MVPLSRLVTCMLSAEYHRVVLTSVALSIIFAHGCSAANARPNNGVRTIDIPPLLPVFIDTFSSTPSGAQSHESSSSSSSFSHHPYPSIASSNSSTTHHHYGDINRVSLSSISSRDWISKADFLDFCVAAVEMKKYTLTV